VESIEIKSQISDDGVNMSRLTYAIVIFGLVQLTAMPAVALDYFVYFGTQRDAPGVGISLARFDSDTGVLTTPRLILPADGPSFFARSPDGGHLYSTNYTGPGGVSAYQIDRATGGLKLLSRIPGGNFGTSHISLDRTGRYALAANFDHGHIAVFPIQPDGSLAAPTAIDKHTGSSINPVRQKVTYPHCVMTDLTNRFALVPDLGLDKLFVYHFDDASGALTACDPPFAAITPGSGPRHVCFHPNGKWGYLISEMGGTVTAFNWDSAAGHLSEFQTISTLPSDFHGENTSAEILVHPNGQFLYASNRGDDSIAVFAIDPATGQLALVERVPTLGKSPRDFALDSTGKWLVCTNQLSDNVVVFGVDQTTGKLTPSGEPIPVPAPCGLLLAPSNGQ
jgi:6-phosphogluconolactonase